MTTHDHGVDEHRDGPESAQHTIARRLQTAPEQWVEHYADKAEEDRRARRDMTLRAALFLSVHGNDEPTSDMAAAALEALRSIYETGSQ